MSNKGRQWEGLKEILPGGTCSYGRCLDNSKLSKRQLQLSQLSNALRDIDFCCLLRIPAPLEADLGKVASLSKEVSGTPPTDTVPAIRSPQAQVLSELYKRLRCT